MLKSLEKDWVDDYSDLKQDGLDVPEEPGLYWAKRHESYRDFNMIIEIQGEPPYLSYIGWDIVKNITVSGIRPCYVFGPKISVEEGNSERED